MKRTFYSALAIMLCSGMLVTFDSCKKAEPKAEAGKAFNHWFASRAFPFETIMTRTYEAEFLKAKVLSSANRSAAFPGTWQNIGPMNFGGRTLCLAFNPLNDNTLYMGSASGGLWKSYSGGIGVNAWQPVPTGFPVLGVGAVAIHPNDSNIIFIGTGEVYNYQNTGTGFAVRVTRGTYGIGILKSVDGGLTWTKSLDWDYDELRGVQHLVFNNENPNSIFAATTEGTYKSLDGGQTWNLIHAILMATDIEINPDDTSMIFVAAGNSFSSNPGIYKSTNGGISFVKLTTGLPATWSGKTLLSVCQSQPSVIYASIADQLSQVGFYRSDNYGSSWTLVNTENVATYQGWYSHDVAVKPDNPDEVIFAGIDSWKSYDGGFTLDQKSYWYNWDFSATPVGGPEGPPDYVHADIHHVYFHPTNFDLVYYVTDGGLFRSDDAGETFYGCNGMYHTQQFYANFSNSTTDTLFGIGGLQDNATPVYEGSLSWRRVIGGDGHSTAIDPTDDQIVYGSSQNLNINKSTDKAQSFNWISNFPGGTITCVSGPFALSKTNTQILYAGNDEIFKSVDGGNNWTSTNGGIPLDGNPALRIEISPSTSDIVYAATAPVTVAQAGLFKTVNGGNAWTDVSSNLPNRYILDIAIDPTNNNKVYTALGGFGTAHLYISTNAGVSWVASGAGLANVPLNTITIDPLNPLIIYAGNDLGIFVSLDGGLNFQPFNDGLYDATLVFDISISPLNRMLRLATHGKGVYERYMLPSTITAVEEQWDETASLNIISNPATDVLSFFILSNTAKKTVLTMHDINGKLIFHKRLEVVKGENRFTENISTLPSGVYIISVPSGNQASLVKKFIKT